MLEFWVEKHYKTRIKKTERRYHMKKNVGLVAFTVFMAGFMILGVLPALAQETPADNMEIVREKIRSDKKLFIAANMGLTESEAKAFWPVYDNYQKDLDGLADRSIKLIQEYAKSYDTMSDEVAKKLLDEYLAIEAERQKLREFYLPSFRKALPEKKVARYYQLENKILAVINYELAAEIPLIQ
jgi:hypothetical protein